MKLFSGHEKAKRTLGVPPFQAVLVEVEPPGTSKERRRSSSEQCLVGVSEDLARHRVKAARFSIRDGGTACAMKHCRQMQKWTCPIPVARCTGSWRWMEHRTQCWMPHTSQWRLLRRQPVAGVPVRDDPFLFVSVAWRLRCKPDVVSGARSDIPVLV